MDKASVKFPTTAYVVAGVGTVALTVARLAFDWNTEQTILAAAPSVLVPLTFTLVSGKPSRIMWAALVLALPCALLFLFADYRARPWAIAPWVAVTVLTLAEALRRVFHGHLKTAAGFIECAALGLPINGSAFAVMYAFSIRPLDLPDIIVFLTGIHFHYTGLALLMMMSCLVRATDWRSVRVAGIVATVATPAIGIGIGFWRPVEAPSAIALALAASVFAVGQCAYALRVKSPLLVVSGLCLIAGMVLAFVFALGNALGTPWIYIPDMIIWHGALNGAGCCGLGILGWVMQSRLNAKLGDGGQHDT